MQYLEKYLPKSKQIHINNHRRVARKYRQFDNVSLLEQRPKPNPKPKTTVASKLHRTLYVASLNTIWPYLGHISYILPFLGHIS